jgi:hypothetical protein
VINIHVQFAMLLGTSIGKEITPKCNCNFGVLSLKTDWYKFLSACLFTAQWLLYVLSNLTKNYIHSPPPPHK